MIYIPNSKMWPNKFVHCEVPTKREIFARTGQRAVSPNGVFTGDEPANMSKTATQSAMEFVKSAEDFDLPADDAK